jgi:hypothetical protein
MALSLFIAVVLSGSAAAEVSATKDPQTGLRTWEWGQAGVKFQLVQRLPDQTRAFFQGRGFSSANADTIARSCVFQTIFRNAGKAPLSYDLDDWILTHKGKTRSLQTRERWDEVWRTRDVGQGPRIAFRWSLLPTRQQFEPGDYNWGMTSFGLPPGERFDLSLRLTLDGKVIDGRIPAITCAADRPRGID